MLHVSVVLGYLLLLSMDVPCMDVPQFVHSLADRHLCCFQFLAVINNVAMNIHEQVLVLTNVFISDTGSLVSLFLLFKENAKLFANWTFHFTFLP